MWENKSYPHPTIGGVGPPSLEGGDNFSFPFVHWQYLVPIYRNKILPVYESLPTAG